MEKKEIKNINLDNRVLIQTLLLISQGMGLPLLLFIIAC